MTKKVYRYHNQPFGLVTRTCLTEFGFTRNLAPGLGIRLRPGIKILIIFFDGLFWNFILMEEYMNGLL